MKTPRELLLDRHRAVEPKLDQIRAGVVANELEFASPPEPRRRHWLPEATAIVWQELILPSRRLWAGLAAAWVLILAINLAGRGTLLPARPSSAGPGVLQVVAEEKRVLAELLQTAAPPAAERLRPTSRPRTQGPLKWRAC